MFCYEFPSTCYPFYGDACFSWCQIRRGVYTGDKGSCFGIKVDGVWIDGSMIQDTHLKPSKACHWRLGSQKFWAESMRFKMLCFTKPCFLEWQQCFGGVETSMCEAYRTINLTYFWWQRLLPLLVLTQGLQLSEWLPFQTTSFLGHPQFMAWFKAPNQKQWLCDSQALSQHLPRFPISSRSIEREPGAKNPAQQH